MIATLKAASVAGKHSVSCAPSSAMNDSFKLRFAFNPAGDKLVVVSPEGRFRLFDTGTHPSRSPADA